MGPRLVLVTVITIHLPREIPSTITPRCSSFALGKDHLFGIPEGTGVNAG